MYQLFKIINIILPEKLKLRLVRLYIKSSFALPHIIFHPTFLCNYKCSYCLYPKYVDKKSVIFESNLPAQDWITLFDKFPPSTITFSGGEPLLYKDLDKLILGLARKHVISQVVSNISVNLDNLVKAKKANFRIMASFHSEMVAKEEFAKNLAYLKKHGFNIVVNYVATKKNMEDYFFYKEYFGKKKKFFFRLDAYEDLYCEEAYEHGQGGPAKIHGLNYIEDRNKFDNYGTKNCLGGFKYFIVMPDANVYRCFSGFMYLQAPLFAALVNAASTDKFLIGNLKSPDFHAETKRFACCCPCKGVCDIELADVRI